MADNIPAAACGSESPQAAKIIRLDTDHEDGTSARLLPSLDAEIFEEPSHAKKVLEGLNRLRLNSALCDLILCCEGQEFPCHRYVLASFSPYFEAMFTSGMKETTQERVTISGVEPQTIGLLVSYAYTSKVSISGANVQALLTASNLWDVTAVREACCDYMDRHMDTNNCVGIYCFADTHSFQMLEKHSMDYVLEHFSVVYHHEEFLSLSMERLTKILASDHLNMPKEDMAFEAAMLWLDKDPTRRQSFEKVLEQIRLPLISPSYLHTVNKSLEVLKEYEGCQTFISEAKNRAKTRRKNRGKKRGKNRAKNQAKPCGTTRPGRTTVIVTMGGRCCRNNYVNKMKSFDLLTNQWKTQGLLPLYVHTSQINSVVMSGSTVYLAGGVSSLAAHSWEIWRYDVTRNSWLKTAPMNETRTRLSLVMLDGYVYAVGGRGKNSMDRYNPSTNTWQLIKCVGVAAYCESKQPSVVALDGLLYFIGGLPSSSKPNPAQVAKYNPETSVWTEVTPMQIPRDNPAVCTLNGKIYLIGGTNIKGETENTMECYHPKTDQWSACAPMEEPRCDPGVVVVDGKICVLGGRQGYHKFLKNIVRYCEETDSWEAVGPCHNACYNLHCVSFRLRDDFPSQADVDDEDDEKEEVDSDAGGDADGSSYDSYDEFESDDGIGEGERYYNVHNWMNV